MAFTLAIPNLNLAGDGTFSAPSYAFLSDSDTGIYRIGDNNLGFATNGAAVGAISATGLWTFGPTTATGAHTMYGTLTINQNDADSEAIAQICSTTTGTTRHLWKNSDSTRTFEFDANFPAGTENFKLQSDLAVCALFTRAGYSTWGPTGGTGVHTLNGELVVNQNDIDSFAIVQKASSTDGTTRYGFKNSDGTKGMEIDGQFSVSPYRLAVQSEGSTCFYFHSDGTNTMGGTGATSQNIVNGTLLVNQNDTDSNALSSACSTTTGCTRWQLQNSNNTRSFQVLGDFTSGTENFKIQSDSSTLLTITRAGLFTIGTGTASTHRLNTATVAAGSDAMTTLNGPAGTAGNPDTFISININGTNHVIPAWTPT